MMAISVGVGRARREAGVRTEERVRRYSWQFWETEVSMLGIA